MFVPATAAPHLWKKTPASLGQFKNGTGQKRFKLKNGLHKKKKNDHRVDEKNVTSGAATLERAWIHTDPAKKAKKTAPHQTYFVCSSLLMMVATATARAPSTERVSCHVSHYQPMMSTLSDAHQLCSELDTRGVPCFPVVEGLYPNHTRSPLPLRAAAVTILTMSDATDLSEIWPRSPVLFRFRPRGSASFAEEDADRCPKFVVMDPSTSVEATLFTLRCSSKSCSKMKKRQSTGNLLDLIDSQMTSLGYKS